MPVPGRQCLPGFALGKYRPRLAAALPGEQKSGMELPVPPVLPPGRVSAPRVWVSVWSGKIWFIIQIQYCKGFPKTIAYVLSLCGDAEAWALSDATQKPGLFQMPCTHLV